MMYNSILIYSLLNTLNNSIYIRKDNVNLLFIQPTTQIYEDFKIYTEGTQQQKRLQIT